MSSRILVGVCPKRLDISMSVMPKAFTWSNVPGMSALNWLRKVYDTTPGGRSSSGAATTEATESNRARRRMREAKRVWSIEYGV